MAEIIEIVGIKYQKYGPEFLENLKEGTLVCLEREPWNHRNSDAVAAKCITSTDTKRVGYVTDCDIEYVAPYLQTQDRLIIPFNGIKRDDSFTLDILQALIFKPFVIKRKDSVFEGKSPLPYDKTPLVMHEELQMIHLVKQFEHDTDLLVDRMTEDKVAMALADEIESVLDAYIPLAKSSLSKECFECISFVCHRLNSLTSIPAYKNRFGMRMKKLEDLKNEFINHHELDAIFKTQMEAMAKQMEVKNLFKDISEDFFENNDQPTSDEIKHLVLGIKDWMKMIPKKAASYFNVDNQRFIRELYNAKLPYMDLHLVYVCLVMLEYCKQLLVHWVTTTVEEPDVMRHKLTLNVIGDIKRLEIGHE